LRLKQAAEPYFKSRGYRFLDWEGSATQLKTWLEDQQEKREKVIVYWKGIRSSPGNYRDWKEIQAHANIGQVLEIYGAALLFFRTNQVREHFKIRL
jgi:predicted Abi (CAAX) family protease